VYGYSQMTAGGEALPDNWNGSLLTHAYARFNTNVSWDHACGAEGNGCTQPGKDFRVTASHEWLHTLGFGHCDLNFGVMCHITAHDNVDMNEGTMFWTPQLRDVWGLEAAYPD
jgi:hypothetical protein